MKNVIKNFEICYYFFVCFFACFLFTFTLTFIKKYYLSKLIGILELKMIYFSGWKDCCNVILIESLTGRTRIHLGWKY